MLAQIAKMNCRPPLSGTLVTQEEKEQMMEERRNTSSPNEKHNEPSIADSANCSSKIEADYITQPNKEETVDNDLTIVSSDNQSDSVQLLVSDEHTHRRTFFQTHIKQFLKGKAFNYYHWFLLLFKNGWWRTTLLLWYIWYVCMYIDTYGLQ